jgi:hypothetical protein
MCYYLIVWDFKEFISGRKRCFCTHVGLSCHAVFRTFTNRELSNFIIIDPTSMLLILNILTTVLIKTIPVIHHGNNITVVSAKKLLIGRIADVVRIRACGFHFVI